MKYNPGSRGDKIRKKGGFKHCMAHLQNLLSNWLVIKLYYKYILLLTHSNKLNKTNNSIFCFIYNNFKLFIKINFVIL